MEKLLEISLLIFCLQLGWVSCLQKVEQNPQFLRVQEGKSITINCNFTENPQGLQWLRQDAGKGPISLFYLASGMKEEGRFKSMINLKERHSSLHITASQPGDSATYHCAVR
uniref:Ig-like domain-containing protein n=1 Tax=Sarcophilus harrisii TaxID=9305 RepID=G3W020_SARHA